MSAALSEARTVFGKRILCAVCMCPLAEGLQQHALTGMFSCTASLLDADSRSRFPVPQQVSPSSFAEPGMEVDPDYDRGQLADLRLKARGRNPCGCGEVLFDEGFLVEITCEGTED